MGQSGKLMPNLDQRSTMILNLTVLQRVDPFVEEILMTAGHVTFYEFNIDLGQWSRKDVEGSFFVVKRNSQPRFQFIVMNRRSADNLVENLLGDFEFEVQVPYLLYRNAAQEVNGIWFYNAKECEEVANLFSRILSAYAKVPQKPIASPSKSEFAELEAVPTIDVIDGPLEPPPSAASNVVDFPDDPAFVNFFSADLSLNSAKPADAGKMKSVPSPAQTSACVTSLPSMHPTIRPSSPAIPLLDAADYGTNSAISSSFFPPPSMMIGATASPAIPSAPHTHTSYRGAPLLQPFPPPSPPASLAPPPAINGPPMISKEKVREALALLVQDNQFIDMVYRAIANSHN